MNDSLESQYEQVITYVEQYLDFRTRMIMVASLRAQEKLGFFSVFKKSWAMQRHNPLSGRTPEESRELIEVGATDKEKQNEYFSIVVSDYSTYSIANRLVSKFPGFDFSKLKKLHEIKENILTFDISKFMIGFYVGIGTILLKSVPKSVVEPFFVYASFERVVFWFVIASLALMLLLFRPSWLRFQSAKSNYEFIKIVLAYIILEQDDKSE